MPTAHWSRPRIVTDEGRLKGRWRLHRNIRQLFIAVDVPEIQKLLLIRLLIVLALRPLHSTIHPAEGLFEPDQQGLHSNGPVPASSLHGGGGPFD